MPPKIKITREDMMHSAFRITREKGIDAITAKALAQDLHCSTQPIYWVFETIENLKQEVMKCANDLYNEYFHKKHENLSRIKAVGINYILFAKEEPQLFRLLFMQDREKNISIFQSTLDDNKLEYLDAISADLGMSKEMANRYYVSMWVFSHGIATMIVTNLTAFTMKEIGEMLEITSLGVMAKLREEHR